MSKERYIFTPEQLSASKNVVIGLMKTGDWYALPPGYVHEKTRKGASGGIKVVLDDKEKKPPQEKVLQKDWNRGIEINGENFEKFAARIQAENKPTGIDEALAEKISNLTSSEGAQALTDEEMCAILQSKGISEKNAASMVKLYNQNLSNNVLHPVRNALVSAEGRLGQMTVYPEDQKSRISIQKGMPYIDVEISRLVVKIGSPGESKLGDFNGKELPGSVGARYEFTEVGPKLVHIWCSNALLKRCLFEEKVLLTKEEVRQAEWEDNAVNHYETFFAKWADKNEEIVKAAQRFLPKDSQLLTSQSVSFDEKTQEAIGELEAILRKKVRKKGGCSTLEELGAACYLLKSFGYDEGDILKIMMHPSHQAMIVKDFNSFYLFEESSKFDSAYFEKVMYGKAELQGNSRVDLEGNESLIESCLSSEDPEGIEVAEKLVKVSAQVTGLVGYFRGEFDVRLMRLKNVRSMLNNLFSDASLSESDKSEIRKNVVKRLIEQKDVQAVQSLFKQGVLSENLFFKNGMDDMSDDLLKKYLADREILGLFLGRMAKFLSRGGAYAREKLKIKQRLQNILSKEKKDSPIASSILSNHAIMQRFFFMDWVDVEHNSYLKNHQDDENFIRHLGLYFDKKSDFSEKNVADLRSTKVLDRFWSIFDKDSPKLVAVLKDEARVLRYFFDNSSIPGASKKAMRKKIEEVSSENLENIQSIFREKQFLDSLFFHSGFDGFSDDFLKKCFKNSDFRGALSGFVDESKVSLNAKNKIKQRLQGIIEEEGADSTLVESILGEKYLVKNLFFKDWLRLVAGAKGLNYLDAHKGNKKFLDCLYTYFSSGADPGDRGDILWYLEKPENQGVREYVFKNGLNFVELVFGLSTDGEAKHFSESEQKKMRDIYLQAIQESSKVIDGFLSSRTNKAVVRHLLFITGFQHIPGEYFKPYISDKDNRNALANFLKGDACSSEVKREIKARLLTVLQEEKQDDVMVKSLLVHEPIVGLLLDEWEKAKLKPTDAALKNYVDNKTFATYFGKCVKSDKLFKAQFSRNGEIDWDRLEKINNVVKNEKLASRIKKHKSYVKFLDILKFFFAFSWAFPKKKYESPPEDHIVLTTATMSKVLGPGTVGTINNVTESEQPTGGDVRKVFEEPTNPKEENVTNQKFTPNPGGKHQ